MASYAGADAVGKAKRLALVVEQMQNEAEQFAGRMDAAMAATEAAKAKAAIALSELSGDATAISALAVLLSRRPTSLAGRLMVTLQPQPPSSAKHDTTLVVW